MLSRRTLPLLTLLSALVLAGCGAGVNAASNNSFALQSPVEQTTTAARVPMEVHFYGHDSEILWTVAGGDPETGPGTIDSHGIYTAPAYLSAASVRVKITAALATDPATRAEKTLTILPAISITPQNVALTPGSETRLYASLAQVGSGSVRWSVAGFNTDQSAGAFSNQHCHTSHDSFTQCVATYTAPATSPEQSADLRDLRDLHIQATLRGSAITAATRLLINPTAAATPLDNESSQAGNDALGTSGGNAHDSANQYCCGGTLGALVEMDGQTYVLSNNHVLARTDQATAGESILQPGLLDTDCGYAPSYTVATLKDGPRLHNPATNVDAAIALAATGAFDPRGNILGFGTSGGFGASHAGALASAPPARDAEDIQQPGARLPQVVKSGRTTGLTCSSISHIAVDIKVNYNTSCDGSGEDFTRTFTNQIAVGGGAFADSGDSGALLADQQTAQPVGLLFAGNAEETFSNPINDVLHALEAHAGAPASSAAKAAIVGGEHHAVACLRYPSAPAAQDQAVPTAAMEDAQNVTTRVRGELMAQDPAILDVAVGPSRDAPGEPALILYVDQTRPYADLPETISGLRTAIILTTAAQLQTSHEPSPDAGENDLSTLPRAAVDAAIAVKNSISASLMTDSAVFGVGVGRSHDDPRAAAIAIFVQRGQAAPQVAPMLRGIRTQILYQDAPRAFDWKHTATPSQHRAGCSLRANALRLPANSVNLP